MAKKVKTPIGTKVTKDVEFDLTEKEFAEKGQAAAALAKEIGDLEVQFEGVKKEWQAKIKDREAQRDDLLSVIHAKKETRLVDTTMVKDFDTKEVQYWYDGKVVEQRTMTENEIQLELDVGAKVKKGRSKPKSFVEATEPKDEEVADVVKQETNKRTKLSAVDGPATL